MTCRDSPRRDPSSSPSRSRVPRLSRFRRRGRSSSRGGGDAMTLPPQGPQFQRDKQREESDEEETPSEEATTDEDS